MNVRSTEEWCDLATEDALMQVADLPLQTCDGWSCLRGHRARTSFSIPQCHSIGQAVRMLNGSIAIVITRPRSAERIDLQFSV